MSNIADPASAGMANQVQTIDFDNATVLRKRVSPVDRSMSKEQAAAYQSGHIAAPEQTAQPVAQLPLPQAPMVPPTSPAAAIPVPAPIPQTFAPASPPPAPTSPAYTPRANDRIAELWGQNNEEIARNDRLERQIIELNRRLDAASTQRAPAAPSNPYTNQYNQSPGFGETQQSPPPGGDFVSRMEMQALLDQQRQQVADAFRLQQQHTASYAKAEQDFPDVYADPNLRADANRIWSSNRSLHSDPNGPYLAAVMARGFRGSVTGSAPAPGTVADVRKTVLSGVGLSSPDGSGAPTADARYQAALARAKATQDPSDFHTAMLIARGQA